MTPILAMLAFSAPIALEVSIPSQVVSGEEVPVVVSAKNISNKPVTLVRASPPSIRLGLKWKTALLKDDKPLFRDERSHWSAQWHFGKFIGPSHFVVLQPGQSAEMYRDKFTYVLPEGGRRETKREDAVAPRDPLAAGEYKFRAHFDFTPTFKPSKGALDPKLTPEGAKLYKQSWVGKVDGEVTFRVVEKQ
jgi:hypothetical protein